MLSRQEIKEIGKAKFKENWGNCVLALLLVSILSVLLSLIGTIGATGSADTGNYVPGPLSGVMSLILLLLAGPLSVGIAGFFINNANGKETGPFDPIVSVKDDLARKIGGYLWMMLMLFLWGILYAAGMILFGVAAAAQAEAEVLLLAFVLAIAGMIPMIVKSMSYAMTPYILADCPNVRARDALKLSMKMMNGHKKDLFLFILSFLGWEILGLFTLGILNIIYVEPYMNSAEAVWYLECKKDALNRTVVSEGNLSGMEIVKQG